MLSFAHSLLTHACIRCEREEKECSQYNFINYSIMVPHSIYLHDNKDLSPRAVIHLVDVSLTIANSSSSIFYIDSDIKSDYTDMHIHKGIARSVRSLKYR